MRKDKMFNGYWMSYPPSGNLSKSTVPDLKVTLFVATPTREGKVGINYLYKEYTKKKQIDLAKQMQNEGTEVLMSLVDTPAARWSDVNIPVFVKNFKAEMIDGDWGLNGVDIDLESEMRGEVCAETFINLIREFRSALGPMDTINAKGQNVSRISLATCRPELEHTILQNIGTELDWLNTMAHGNGLCGPMVSH